MSDATDSAQDAVHHVEHHGASMQTRAIAVLIAILAATLALAEKAEKGALTEYQTDTIGTIDGWAAYQAKNTRATVYAAKADILANLPNAAEPKVQEAIKQARQDEARMRDEPGGDGGMKQIAATTKEKEKTRDLAFHRHNQLELVSGSLQISIVLASIAVVTSIPLLAYGAMTIGVLAGLFGLYTVWG